MVSSGQLPELIFSLALSLALSVGAFGVLYWVIRLAVRHALMDVERRQSAPRR
jgi:hypothetical protein